MIKFYDHWRNLHKKAPETIEEFEELFEGKLGCLGVTNMCSKDHIHFTYRVYVKGENRVVSMFIGEGNYDMYEVWNGYSDPVGCWTTEDVIKYIRSRRGSKYENRNS